MRILSLAPGDERLIEQAAHLLVEAFAEHWPEAWPTVEDGLREVGEMLGGDRICRVAVDRDGNLLGVIGGIPSDGGRAWELHPLAVHPSAQGRGIGRTLVRDFEEQVGARGAVTITLGTDDEDGMTTLGHTDLHEDLWGKIRGIRNLKHHPFEFYQKLGFVISGVVIDANGPGKPDILMTKKVG